MRSFLFLLDFDKLDKYEFDVLYFFERANLAKMGGNAEVHGFRPCNGTICRGFLLLILREAIS